ncbi:hypothetical protein QQZ08_002302 [Neonectria magnoliae]|uniref:Uncharacterized protein n=1 Tax=Neonectria magnoliae TaxID=2732573 RepID=A0ABR1ICJ2_9HYPO
MDRSRRTTQRRRPLGDSASPRSASEASFDLNLSTSPVAAHINTTPQSAHSGGPRRSSKPVQRAFTFSPPGPNRGLNLRKRSSIMDNFSMADDDEDGPKKGGHSLRKRARVDYTFEHIEDDVVVPNSSSSARGRKRRPETNFDTEDLYGTDPKRRGVSMGADTPSARRRNPSRKSSEMKAYREALEDDDNDVQDTIEVGISYSDVDGSETHEPSWSNPSSPHSTKTPPKPDPAVPSSDSNHPKRPSIEDAAEAPRPAPRPAPQTTLDAFFSKTRVEKSVSQPAERPQSESTKVEPRAEASPLPPTPLPSTDVITAAPSTTAIELPVAGLEPLAAELVAEPVAVEPAAIKPVAVNAVLIEAPAAESLSIDAALAKSPVDQPGASGPVGVKPVAAEPAAVESAAVESAAVESAAVEPAAVEPTTIEPATVEPATVEPATVEPATVEPAAVEPAAVDSAAVVAAASEPLASADEVAGPPSSEPIAVEPVVESVAIESPASESIQLPSETQVNGESKSSVKDVVEEGSKAANHIKKETMEEVSNTTRVTPMQDKEAQNNEDRDNKDLNNENTGNETLDNEDKMDVDPVVELARDTEMAESEPEEPAHPSTPHLIEIAQETPASPNLNSKNTRPNQSEDKVDPIDSEPSNPARELPNTIRTSDSPQPVLTTQDPTPSSKFEEVKAPTLSPTIETPDSLPSTQSEPKSSPKKIAPPRPTMTKPQPAPTGRWSHLTPYVDGEFVLYPEKKGRAEDDATADEPTPEGKDTDREGIDMEPMVEDNDENAVPEAPTPALNTPTRGSPVPESTDPTAFNSPAPAGEDPDDADVSESQEPPDRRRYFKYRKLRDPEEYISAIENFEDMPTADLFEILESINISLVQWQHEWTGLGKVVDDYENALRRRAADTKYESRTRNLHQHGVNYEEPDFGVKGYKAREKEGMTETRYLQGQDRIMAANYGFEYDPHPSKIGRQNPETQQVGIMTRGRSLRNQPRQTAKATETDEVTGKRQRKPVQLFDPAAVQDVSRSSTPVPTRGRRRRGANGDGEETQSNPNTSFNTDVVSDGEGTLAKTRRRRGPRAKGAVPSIVEELLPEQDDEESAANEEFAKPTRRGRGRPAIRYEEADPNDFVDEEPQPEPQPEPKQPRRHLLTLKIPRGKHFSEPTSSITDNGDSRPSTASSEESSHTAESSYSFRPKRQKRFRDDPDGSEEAAQAPPKKRGKRANASLGATDGLPAPSSGPTSEPSQTPNNRKVHKIKVVRSGAEIRNGAPSVPVAPIEDLSEAQKDYKSMTKSEKMSASMKNRWANGNMAGAVEKRKATLAAKKAAQVAADQKLGVIAPKPKGKAAAKKEAAMQLQQQQQQQQQHHQQHHQQQHHQQHQHHQQQHHQHQHHQQLHMQQQLHQHQHPQQYPAHQGGNPNFVHGMPGMGGYPYQQM